MVFTKVEDRYHYCVFLETIPTKEEVKEDSEERFRQNQIEGKKKTIHVIYDLETVYSPENEMMF